MPPTFSEDRIAELLSPFLGEIRLSEVQLNQVSTYLDLLLRWNAKINLTAVRNPKEIITRHFGESFFAARHLLIPRSTAASSSEDTSQNQRLPELSRPLAEVGASCKSELSKDAIQPATTIDIGSGAGFPGLPLKIFGPELDLTLVESNQKKAFFLRELVRSLNLTRAVVFSNRAEQLGAQASLVTLRAVERFETILPIAASCVSTGGRLAMLIGASQFEIAKSMLYSPATQIGTMNSQIGKIRWLEPISIPLSRNRILAVAHFD